MSKTVFFKPKSRRLANAISITSPAAFHKSIKRVKAMRGIKPSTKKKALVLARTRATMQLRRKNLSHKERQQMAKIAGTRIPKISK